MATSELIEALQALAHERKIDEFYLIERLEQSLAKSYERILDLEWDARVTIDRQTGKIYVRDLRGIGKEMPITTWCWTIASLGLIGIPPTGGFVSKWELATGSLQTGLAGFDVIGPVILIVSALLTAAYLLPVTINGFFPGSDYDYAGLTNKEGGKLMTVPMILLAIGVVVTGVFAQPLINAIAAAAASVL